MELKSRLESILFVATKPVSATKLAELAQSDLENVSEALRQLQSEYNDARRGIQLISHNSKVQFMTHPDCREAVETYLKEEQFGELTKPGLETLTIIAYRGPVSKAALEQIRGVNCSMILRNLLIKGLVEAEDDKTSMQTLYSVTFDFLRYLGVSAVQELPDFEKLSRHESIEQVLEIGKEETEVKEEKDES
ncbi:MAG: SMC-Scp complex subunit ScpB [bacterium]|nr:SMC-Scp complex subunit ScpB [bacterium]